MVSDRFAGGRTVFIKVSMRRMVICNLLHGFLANITFRLYSTHRQSLPNFSLNFSLPKGLSFTLSSSFLVVCLVVPPSVSVSCSLPRDPCSFALLSSPISFLSKCLFRRKTLSPFVSLTSNFDCLPSSFQNELCSKGGNSPISGLEANLASKTRRATTRFLKFDPNGVSVNILNHSGALGEGGNGRLFPSLSQSLSSSSYWFLLRRINNFKSFRICTLTIFFF